MPRTLSLQRPAKVTAARDSIKLEWLPSLDRVDFRVPAEQFLQLRQAAVLTRNGRVQDLVRAMARLGITTYSWISCRTSLHRYGISADSSGDQIPDIAGFDRISVYSERICQDVSAHSFQELLRRSDDVVGQDVDKRLHEVVAATSEGSAHRRFSRKLFGRRRWSSS